MTAIRLQLVAAVGLISVIAAVTSAQDFHKEYGAGSTLIVHNVSGDVIVKGYDGSQIVVDGLATGADRTKVSVEDLSQGDRVELRAHYPRNCDCDASIKFEIKVPRSLRCTIGPLSTASGDISVEDVTGQVSLRSASGNVAVRRVVGQVTASTAAVTSKSRRSAAPFQQGPRAAMLQASWTSSTRPATSCLLPQVETCASRFLRA